MVSQTGQDARSLPSAHEKHRRLPDTAQTDETPSSILDLGLVLQDHSAIRLCRAYRKIKNCFSASICSDCSLITALMHAIVQILRQHPRGRQFAIDHGHLQKPSARWSRNSVSSFVGLYSLNRGARVSANLIGALRAEMWRRGLLAGRVLPTTAPSGFNSIELWLVFTPRRVQQKPVMYMRQRCFPSSVQRFFARDYG